MHRRRFLQGHATPLPLSGLNRCHRPNSIRSTMRSPDWPLLTPQSIRWLSSQKHPPSTAFPRRRPKLTSFRSPRRAQPTFSPDSRPINRSRASSTQLQSDSIPIRSLRRPQVSLPLSPRFRRHPPRFRPQRHRRRMPHLGRSLSHGHHRRHHRGAQTSTRWVANQTAQAYRPQPPHSNKYPPHSNRRPSKHRRSSPFHLKPLHSPQPRSKSHQTMRHRSRKPSHKPSLPPCKSRRSEGLTPTNRVSGFHRACGEWQRRRNGTRYPNAAADR